MDKSFLDRQCLPVPHVDASICIVRNAEPLDSMTIDPSGNEAERRNNDCSRSEEIELFAFDF